MKNLLAPFSRSRLPEFPGWKAFIGPGLIWMALAQGSGELIWWPYIVAKYGTGFLFLLIPACLLQLPLNVEIGRYTLVTGEGIFRGFLRLNRTYGLIVYVLFILSFLWFGAFASAGGTALGELTQFPPGFSPKAKTLFWGQVSIIAFMAGLLLSKMTYRLIEWVMKIVAIGTLIGMVLACMHPDVVKAWVPVVKGLFIPPFKLDRPWDPADATKLLTAITFAGLGGFWTTFYSYWVKEKKAGMSFYGQQLVGLRAGAKSITLGGGTVPEEDNHLVENSERWHFYLVVDSLVGILGNLLTTILTCILAYALLNPQGVVPDGYELAVVQSRFFEASWGAIGRILFLFVAGAFLADTWLATVDSVARIHIDVLTAVWPAAAKWSVQKLYILLVIALTIITSVTMFFDQPGPLILLSAVIGFIGTVTFTAGLIRLNHGYLKDHLPAEVQPSRHSYYAIVFVWLAYFALLVLYLKAKFFA